MCPDITNSSAWVDAVTMQVTANGFPTLKYSKTIYFRACQQTFLSVVLTTLLSFFDPLHSGFDRCRITSDSNDTLKSDLSVSVSTQL